MNSRQQCEAYEERRKYPRLRCHIPIKVQYKEKKFIHARIHDLSPDGLQIRCDPKTAALLHPGNKLMEKGKGPSVIVAFTLPGRKASRKIVVRCQLYYFALLAEKQIRVAAFGLRFRKFKGECDKFVGQFIIDEMEPVDPLP
ncbi:MAG: PilZ domain-containing protein [Gammaproteobacteria bacterium]